MNVNVLLTFGREANPEKVKLFQIGALAPNNSEPEGAELRLQNPGVELRISKARNLLEHLTFLTFI